jgi:N-acyl-D-aspartate/D-glutamate deacylase
MPRTLFTNVSMFDGSGQSSFPGEVLVQGNRIKTVAKGKDQIDRGLAEEIVDGGGATLCPA